MVGVKTVDELTTRFRAEGLRVTPQRQVIFRLLHGVDTHPTVESLYEAIQMPPQVPATASRVAVPVYNSGTQVGKATSTTWSPVLKKMIALATVEAGSAKPGTRLEVEVTVEAVRHRVAATVTPTPFFNPPRKTSSVSKP